MYDRFIKNKVEVALSDTPVVLITGPRQSGKTTFVKELLDMDYPYMTLDDPIALDFARKDPTGFVRGFDRVIIDEVQRSPELSLAIKKSVDEDGRPGRFLLTGSANILFMTSLTDSLVGRMEGIDLLPLAQAEINSTPPTFLHRLFTCGLAKGQNEIIGDDLIQAVLSGGFPRAVQKSESRRRQWVQSYVKFVLNKDIEDLNLVEKLELDKLLEAVAIYSGQRLNYSRIAPHIGVSVPTVQRYTKLLEQFYIITVVRPWHTNDLKKLVKTPKVHFLDSGVLAATQKLSFDKLKNDRSKFGPLLESFVFSEIQKLMTASDSWYKQYYFLDHEKREVDIVLERDDGMIAGIEVKAAATVQTKDFTGLRILKESLKDRFAFGAVLYDSNDYVPFGNDLAAVPISYLWA